MIFWVLFGSSLLAATLLPGASEATLLYSLTQSDAVFLLWLVATFGNTLGAGINYAMGRYLLHFQQRRWFPVREKEMQRSQRWFDRYGQWSLLLSWLPIVGDGFTLIAGIMKLQLWRFVVLTAIGKGSRYAAIIWLVTA